MERLQFKGKIRYWKPGETSGLAVMDVPDELVPAIGGLKQQRVHGTFGAADFTSNVMPAGGAHLALSVSKAMMAAGGVTVGDEADVAITRVGKD